MVLAERFAAAAGAAGVGVAHFETLAVQAVVKVDGRTIQVREAGGVDEDLEALALEFLVAFLADVEGHAVLETGAASGLDEDAEGGFRVGLLGMQSPDLLGGGFGEVDHAFHIMGLQAESRGAV